MRTGPATVERTLSTVERDVRVLFKVNLLCVVEWMEFPGWVQTGSFSPRAFCHQWKGLWLLRSVIWVSLFAPGLWSAICGGGGTHMLRHTGMCRPNGLLFHQKSLDMGPTLVKKILRGGSHFKKIAKKLWNQPFLRQKNP